MAIAATLLLAEASAQEPRRDLFQDQIDVRLVNVEVVVTDASGRRIEDLSAGDFRLSVDGEPVPIAFFSAIERGATVAPASDAPGPAPGAGPGRVGTHLLIFVDDALTTERDRNRVLEGLARQLAVVGPDDRTAIVAFDGRALQTLQPWTSDPRQLASALALASARPAYGARRWADLRAMDDWAASREHMEKTQQELIDRSNVRSTTGPLDEDEAEPPGKYRSHTEREPGVLSDTLSGPDVATAQQLTLSIERGVAASVHAMRTAAAPAGRKVMLMLLGGWPLEPASFVANRFGRDLRDVATAHLDGYDGQTEALFAPLVDTANLLGYSLYPVDVAGGARQVGWDATDSPDRFQLADPSVGGGGSGLDRELDVHAALEHLAGRTGGLAMVDAQRDQALVRAWEDTRSYYWLGFTPRRAGDDQSHSIRVEVADRPDLEVRARSGFVDLSRDREQELAMESALLLQPLSASPTAPAAGPALLLELGEPRKSGTRTMLVGAELGIPLDAITLLPQNGRFVNQLEIRFLVVDKDGNRSEVSVDRLPIRGSTAPQSGQRIWYQTVLAMRRRDHRLFATVYDPLSGALLTVHSRVEATP